MPELTPNVIDTRYGPSIHHRYDALTHPVQDPGGNPCLILRHGGGWNSNDKRLPWIASQRLNGLAFYLTQMRSGAADRHWTVISVATRQAAWATPLSSHSANASLGWFDEPVTLPTFFPEVMDDMQRAIVAIKANATALNIDPNRIVVGGSSAGSTMALLSQMMPPITASGSTAAMGDGLRYGAAGHDSLVRGVFNYIGAVDFRMVGASESVALSNWYNFVEPHSSMTASKITTALRQAISPIAYVEKGNAATLPHVYSLYIAGALGTKPYTDPHDPQQMHDLRRAYEKVGASSLHGGSLAASWSDSDPATRDAVSAGVYEWMNDVIVQPSSPLLGGAPLVSYGS